LSERILKSSQVLLGLPLEIKPVNYNSKTDNGIKDGNNVDKANDPLNSETAQEIFNSLIERANSEAVRIIDEAKAMASMIISEAGEKAEKEMEKHREAARAEGFEVGLREGKAEGKRKYEKLIKEAENIWKKANEEYANILRSAEDDMVALVMNIAKKVINTELTTNRKIILNLVSEALLRTANRDNLTIRVSREDYDFLKENEEYIKERVDSITYLDIKADSALDAGSCIVETNYGCIDSGVKTKMEKLKAVFLEVIRTREQRVYNEKSRIYAAK
jgi:flagellar assembly protein FliH